MIIDFNVTSIAFGACFLFAWFIDAFVNFILASRLETRRYSYLIPYYSYYRFGVLVGIRPVIVLIGLVSSVVATRWYHIDMASEVVIIIYLIAIAINSTIIERAAKQYGKAKYRYFSGMVLCGLLSLGAILPILLLAQYFDSIRLLMGLMLAQAIIMQLPRIILAMTTTKINMQAR